ncbi:Rhs element Vgr protein, partial [Pseudomonas syringae pv. actinidiae ICMP 19096]
QGKVTVHASEHDWIGPKTDSASIPSFGRDPAAQQVTFHYPGHSEASPRAAADHSYEIKLEDGSLVKGMTNADGLTERVEREMMHQAQVSALRSGAPKGGA